MATNTRDPRTVITPEAFGIDDALLGIPLARPGRRLAALVIDLVIIGILTAVTSGFTIFIWALVGLFLVQAAFRRPTARLGQVTSVLFRGSAGCLGVVVLLVVLAVGVANRVARELPDVDLSEVEGLSDEGRTLVQALGQVASGVGGARLLGAAETREEAETAALELLDDFGSLALDFGSGSDLERDEALRAMVLEAMPADPAYTDDPRAFADEMVDRWLRQEGDRARRVAAAGEERAQRAEGAAPASDSTLDRLRGELASLEPPAVLDRYRAGLDDGLGPDTDPGMAVLRERLVGLVAGDTLAALESALAEESRSRRRAEERASTLRDELRAEEGGFVALLRDIWDQAGSAVGLWSLYFTVTLTLFQGFTVGKRLMGIRVVRLDGQRITWWSAFERAGGYVAGIATGTMGFLQVFWDPNRQCVHDKIGHTAVVVAGAGPIQGAVEAAWDRDETAGTPAPDPASGDR